MLKVKVADSPHLWERGLMFVKSMPKDEGMLFVFKRAEKLGFWGSNTFIPLDIAFVDHNLTIKKIGNIEPFSLDMVRSGVDCIYAVEANAGYFVENDVTVGDVIEIDRPSFKDEASVSFRKTSKDSASKQGKIKESQVGIVPAVKKPGEETIGQPIIDHTSAQPNEMIDQNLPTVGPSDIGQYLEDDFDTQDSDQQVEDGLDGKIDGEPQDDEPPTQETEYPVFENVFDASEWAEKNLEVVRINYTTKHGRALIRDVEPHGRFHSESTKKEILVTYDETVNGIRAFIATNIGNWAFVGRKFQKKFVVKA